MNPLKDAYLLNRQCTSCKQHKSQTAAYFRVSKAGYMFHTCRSCEVKKNNDYKKRKKAENKLTAEMSDKI